MSRYRPPLIEGESPADRKRRLSRERMNRRYRDDPDWREDNPERYAAHVEKQCNATKELANEIESMFSACRDEDSRANLVGEIADRAEDDWRVAAALNQYRLASIVAPYLEPEQSGITGRNRIHGDQDTDRPSA